MYEELGCRYSFAFEIFDRNVNLKTVLDYGNIFDADNISNNILGYNEKTFLEKNHVFVERKKKTHKSPSCFILGTIWD